MTPEAAIAVAALVVAGAAIGLTVGIELWQRIQKRNLLLDEWERVQQETLDVLQATVESSHKWRSGMKGQE